MLYDPISSIPVVIAIVLILGNDVSFSNKHIHHASVVLMAMYPHGANTELGTCILIIAVKDKHK